MANHKSPAAQAIRDMLEEGFDVTILTGLIIELHVKNAEVGIITKQRVRRVKKQAKASNPSQRYTPRLRHVYNRSLTINPDGTISLGFTEWDYKLS